MAITNPYLGGTQLASLAADAGYEVDYFLHGASTELADGTVATQVIGSGSSYGRLFSLKWKSISTGEASSIESKYWSMVSSGSAAFVDPHGDAYTVQPTKDVGFSKSAVKKNNNVLLYDVTVKLLEVV